MSGEFPIECGHCRRGVVHSSLWSYATERCRQCAAPAIAYEPELADVYARAGALRIDFTNGRYTEVAVRAGDTRAVVANNMRNAVASFANAGGLK